MSSQTEELKWISTLEEMPDADTTVLIYTNADGENIWLGYYEDDFNGWRFVEGGAVPHIVTHWAEMPEGPK
jgi:hypothetical protein